MTDTLVQPSVAELEPRLLAQLQEVLNQLDPETLTVNKQTVDDILLGIDKQLGEAVNRVMFDKEFRRLEGVWRGLSELDSLTDYGKNIVLGLWDVKKEELNDDVSSNVADWTNSELFSVLYTKEYDQHGGSPFGALIGLYEFDQGDDDLGLL
ncbi:MAG: hypothetical protein RJA70_3620, partial [Pseudomonadota bacterium]